MIVKIIISIIVLIAFAVFFKLYILDILLKEPVNIAAERFTAYKPANTRISYYNIGEYPWNRHSINSSIPYDVKVKQESVDAPYYEIDNEAYNNKLKEVFVVPYEELIIAMEGTTWSKWNNPRNLDDANEMQKLNRYYNAVINIINNKLKTPAFDIPTDAVKNKIQVIHDVMNKYKYNENDRNYYLFDIELILYRDGKIQGKHIKLFAITDGKSVHIIYMKIIGVISEDNIMLYPYVANDTMNNMDFSIFIPESRVNDIAMNTDADNLDDRKTKNEIENVLYKKLLDNYNYEHADISNNTYNEEKETLYRSNFAAMVNNFMEEK